MGLETGSTLSSLDATWPLSGDNIQQGDDHLRLLKAVLKAQFPGDLGQGFAIPITANEVELNYVAGATSNLQAQIDALNAVSGIEIPVGTIMLFYQAAAPVGWTQIANDDNSMLRMVSGVGGGVGGSDSPINLTVAAHLHTTSPHTLTIAEMPAHTHTYIHQFRTQNGGSGSTHWEYDDPIETASTGGDGPHTHGNTGSDGGFSFVPRYIDVIQASKD